MAIIRAQLKLNIAIEEYNAIAETANSSWAALKKAADKIDRAEAELQAAKLGLR